MSLSTVHVDVLQDARRTYVGGIYDIYPLLHRGIGYNVWYLGLWYFYVSLHVHYVYGICMEF